MLAHFIKPHLSDSVFYRLVINSLVFPYSPGSETLIMYFTPRDFLGNIKQQQMGAIETLPRLCFSIQVFYKNLSVMKREEVGYVFLHG